MVNWICSQIGAREHYAIPRTLLAQGRLARLYTDFWATPGWRALGRLTGQTGLATRYHPDLKTAPVSAFNLLALAESRRSFVNPYEGFLLAGESFGRRVVRALEGRESKTGRDVVFFGYDTGFLEPARWVRTRGGRTVVCQMDPSRYEAELVKAEEERWPGWAKRPLHTPEAYFQRREEEWGAADLVMVNSEWTQQALVRQGVDGDRIVVVPLAYEGEHSGTGGQGNRMHPGHDLPGHGFTDARPLRVLFLGQVILRKGIQYLLEAARLLGDEPILFDVVGPIGISDKGVASAPRSVTFHGPVSRDRTGGFYEDADLFVLPTLSDGFGLTQLEAMSRGLPVIVTPNCGEVVTDQRDGMIVPAGDPMALAEALQWMAQDPSRLGEMRVAAMAKAAMFGLPRLAGNLSELAQRLQ